MLTKKQSRRSNRTFLSAVSRLEKQVKGHLAWRGDISLIEAADLLKAETPFTFILSSGFDKNHYILSFVSDRGIVKHIECSNFSASRADLFHEWRQRGTVLFYR